MSTQRNNAASVATLRYRRRRKCRERSRGTRALRQSTAKLPAAAVRPGISEEVAEIVKFAAAEKLALVACGARTKLGMGLRAQPLRSRTRYDAPRSRDRLRSRRPHPQRRSRRAARKTRASCSPNTINFCRWPVPFVNRTTIGGVDRLRRGLAAAPILRHRARFPPGHGICHRRRRRREKRRPRREKCHRLRHPQIDDWRAGHAGRHHSREFQDVSDAAGSARRSSRGLRQSKARWTCAIASRNRRSRR